MNLLDAWAFSLICTNDWKGQPRTEKGRFDFGKLRATGKVKTYHPLTSGKMTREEKKLVSSEILTWHPEYKVGETHSHLWRGMYYRFDVMGAGEYYFGVRFPIIGNEALIERFEKRHGG